MLSFVLWYVQLFFYMLTKTQMCEELRWNYNNNYYKQNNITTIDTSK